jgi:hypothetical protein
MGVRFRIPTNDKAADYLGRFFARLCFAEQITVP